MVVLTREQAIPVLKRVCVAVVTSRVRGIPTEVLIGEPEGLARDCVINCDNIYTVPKSSLDRYRGSLGPEAIRRLDDALRIALGLD